MSLGNIDYVGTRLHAGIHALNHGIRSIIVEVDNRSAEIAKDTNLPVIKRDAITSGLKKMIESEWPTQITIDSAAISKFVGQFKNTQGSGKE